MHKLIFLGETDSGQKIGLYCGQDNWEFDNFTKISVRPQFYLQIDSNELWCLEDGAEITLSDDRFAHRRILSIKSKAWTGTAKNLAFERLVHIEPVDYSIKFDCECIKHYNPYRGVFERWDRCEKNGFCYKASLTPLRARIKENADSSSYPSGISDHSRNAR